MHSDAEEIARFVRSVRERPARADTGARRIELGQVDPDQARSIRESAAAKGVALDVVGYRHALDNFGVRHVLKEHGDAARESRRGQLAIGDADFARIPEILAHPSRVEYAGSTRIGRAAILYEGTDGTTRLTYVAEVRPARMMLMLVSMRKTES